MEAAVFQPLYSSPSPPDVTGLKVVGSLGSKAPLQAAPQCPAGELAPGWCRAAPPGSGGRGVEAAAAAWLVCVAWVATSCAHNALHGCGALMRACPCMAAGFAAAQLDALPPPVAVSVLTRTARAAAECAEWERPRAPTLCSKVRRWLAGRLAGCCLADWIAAAAGSVHTWRTARKLRSPAQAADAGAGAEQRWWLSFELDCRAGALAGSTAAVAATVSQPADPNMLPEVAELSYERRQAPAGRR